MAAEKQVVRRSMGPYYVLSAYDGIFDRTSEHFLGRLHGNALCTRYELHGRGQRPKRLHGSGAEDAEPPREELAVVRFRKPTDAPRSMEVAVPAVAADGSRSESRPRDPRNAGLQCAWEQREQAEEAAAGGPEVPGAAAAAPEREPWHRLVSSRARWDEARQVYSMNFHGRVKRSSSKNFQLVSAGPDFVDPGTDHELVMQFGRVEEDAFALDVARPLSPAQALAIALSMFDSRIAERFRMYY